MAAGSAPSAVFPAGAGQPHRHRAAGAHARAHPRPQRHSAGQQLRGLHPGNHAEQDARPGSDHRSTALHPADFGIRGAAFSQPAEHEPQLRGHADPQQAHRCRGGAFRRAALSLPRRGRSRQAVPQLPARGAGQSRHRLHRPHRAERAGQDCRQRRGFQLSGHRPHRQDGRGAAIRGAAPRHRRLRGGGGQRRGQARAQAAQRSRGARQHPGAVARHPPAEAGRGFVRQPHRRLRGDGPSIRRGARLRVHAHLRPQPVRRGHRSRELERAQHGSAQTPAQPRAARHLSARLHLQALPGAGRPVPGHPHAELHAERSRLLHARQAQIPRRRARRPRPGRHAQGHRGVVRHLFLHGGQRLGRGRHARLHAQVRLRPAYRHRPARRSQRPAAVQGLEAPRLQESRAAALVSGRDHQPGNRPGLQQLHADPDGQRPGRHGQPGHALQAAHGQDGGEHAVAPFRAHRLARDRKGRSAAGDVAGGSRRHGGREHRARRHRLRRVQGRSLHQRRKDRHGPGVHRGAEPEIQRVRSGAASAGPRAVHRLRPGGQSHRVRGADRRARRVGSRGGRAHRAQAGGLSPAGDVSERGRNREDLRRQATTRSIPIRQRQERRARRAGSEDAGAWRGGIFCRWRAAQARDAGRARAQAPGAKPASAPAIRPWPAPASAPAAGAQPIAAETLRHGRYARPGCEPGPLFTRFGARADNPDPDEGVRL